VSRAICADRLPLPCVYSYVPTGDVKTKNGVVVTAGKKTPGAFGKDGKKPSQAGPKVLG
jgi:hypothetical protein